MDTNTIDSQLTYLEETKSLLKEAIVNKGQSIQETDTFRSYIDKIDQISTLAEETADATATASDILEGQTAYVNGQKLVGNIRTFFTDSFVSGNWAGYDSGNDMIQSDATFSEDRCQKAGSDLLIETDAEIFRNNIGLTANKIVKGNTILGMNGTATADATATENDIVYNKTAYVNGEKITGTIPQSNTEDQGLFLIDTNVENWDNVGGGMNYVDIKMVQNREKILYRNNDLARVRLQYEPIAELFGVTPEKIVEGNTILGVVGTGKTSEDLQAQLDAQDELIASQQAQIEELKSLLADKASNVTNESITTVNNVLGNEEV